MDEPRKHFLKKKKTNTKCCFEFAALVNWWDEPRKHFSEKEKSKYEMLFWICCSCELMVLVDFHDFLWIACKALENPGKIFIYKFLVVWLLVFMCMTNQEGWRCIWSCCFWSPHYEKEKILKFENVCAFESFQTSLAEKKIIYGLTCK